MGAGYLPAGNRPQTGLMVVAQPLHCTRRSASVTEPFAASSLHLGDHGFPEFVRVGITFFLSFEF
jgi:hypothetical protein